MLTFKIMMSLIDSETMMCVVDLVIMMSIVVFFYNYGEYYRFDHYYEILLI